MAVPPSPVIPGTPLITSLSGDEKVVLQGVSPKGAVTTAQAIANLAPGGGGSGTVTSISVVSTNGFSGTVANPTTTPALTLQTTLTGLLKGNATALLVATPSVDYVIPSDLGAYITTAAAAMTFQPLDADLTALAALSTTGIMVRTGSATFSLRSITGTANRIVVTQANGVAGNPTLDIGTDVLTNSAAAAVYLTIADAAATYEPIGAPGTGTVTDFSVVTANGFAASVANSTTTPAVTLRITATGILKSNGTTTSAATPSTDYVIPSDLTPYLLSATAASTYQPLDSDLTAIAALSTTGILARTGSGTYSPRTITGTTNLITVTNGDGVAGNPTLTVGSSVVVLTGAQTLDAKSLTAVANATLAKATPSISAGVLTLALGGNNFFVVPLNANITTLTITGATAGSSFVLWLTGDGTQRTITGISAIASFGDAGVPVPTLTNGKVTVLTFMSDNGSRWAATAGTGFF